MLDQGLGEIIKADEVVHVLQQEIDANSFSESPSQKLVRCSTCALTVV
jgi:hypothetical protein